MIGIGLLIPFAAAFLSGPRRAAAPVSVPTTGAITCPLCEQPATQLEKQHALTLVIHHQYPALPPCVRTYVSQAARDANFAALKPADWVDDPAF